MLSHCIAIHGLYFKGVQWNGGIVLQYDGLKELFFFSFCIANTLGVLWLGKDLGLRIVLQYNYCIVTNIR